MEARRGSKLWFLEAREAFDPSDGVDVNRNSLTERQSICGGRIVRNASRKNVTRVRAHHLIDEQMFRKVVSSVASV